MFVKSLDDLPENLRSQFVESELNGDKGFQHKDTVSLANSMRNAKQERDTYKAKLSDIESRLTEFEQSKHAEIEAAKADALEKARSSGDVEAIEKRYQQQMDDLATRKDAEAETWKTKYSKLKEENNNVKRNSIVNDLASQMANEKGMKALKRLLASRISIDNETGKEIFLDEDGSATSLDLKGFKQEIEKDEMFLPLLKSGIVTNGGINLNGGGGGATTNKKFNELSGSELSAIRKKDPAMYDRLKSEFHNR